MTATAGRRKSPRLVLASASPRRKEILEAAGIAFEVLPAPVPEQQRRGESAEEFVIRMAIEKAVAARALVPPPCLLPVLGADTVVVLGQRTLGKPASREQARRMLRLLSGKQHQVLTGLCLLYPAKDSGRKGKATRDVRVATTTVKFRRLSQEEIEQYLATGEPFDKAGAYAIQGRACQFVEWIHGCYFNVVGLPVALLARMLQKMDAATRTRSGGKR